MVDKTSGSTIVDACHLISNVQGYKLIQRAESERDMIHILTCHVTVGRQQGRHGHQK